jgi:5-methylcytosine-specific restriction endonuclease McrBC GTP-binding regulatory subunit McrB
LKDIYYGNRAAWENGVGIYYPGIVERLKSYGEKSISDLQKNKNYAIIIDEINRGNVSQIFGELITLIEDDKRIDQKEALKATLPYSKDEFGVPPNLYIIGTMNTADRSVEAIDTALRRRFSFVPQMPDYNELNEDCQGVNLKSMLQKLNERLTLLKDRDHTIGHAWLWNINTIDALKIAFKDKIIPLLQEFFYNDYEKLGLLLGDKFVVEEIKAKSDLFANFQKGIGLRNQYANKTVFKITEPSSWDEKAFQSIYKTLDK